MRVVTLSGGLIATSLNFHKVKFEIWVYRSREGSIIDIHHVCIQLRKTSEGYVSIAIKVVNYIVGLIGRLAK
jgi:hypothetical protein